VADVETLDAQLVGVLAPMSRPRASISARVRHLRTHFGEPASQREPRAGFGHLEPAAPALLRMATICTRRPFATERNAPTSSASMSALTTSVGGQGCVA
jgi:hypothetical protein